jgi:hypothetical protein
VFIEPEDEVYDIVEGLHLTIITVKKGLQMTDDVVGHCFDVDHYMDVCQKLKHDMKTIVA